VARAFEEAHSLGMVTILWCLKIINLLDNVDYNSAADITGQANYLGVSLQADIYKTKITNK
jgi:class I fructose-bisphosphate aldolase